MALQGVKVRVAYPHNGDRCLDAAALDAAQNEAISRERLIRANQDERLERARQLAASVIHVNGEPIPSVATVCTDRRPGYGKAAQWAEPVGVSAVESKAAQNSITSVAVPFAVEAAVQIGVVALFFINPVVGILAMVGMSGREYRHG